jgi:hypothetical protein
MLLLALGVTFFFEGVAEPGDLQRAIGTILIGATLMFALYAAELPSRRLRVAGALILTIVLGVVIASVAGKGMTAEGIAAIANALLVALAPPAVVTGIVRNLRARLCISALQSWGATASGRATADAGVRTSGGQGCDD